MSRELSVKIAMSKKALRSQCADSSTSSKVSIQTLPSQGKRYEVSNFVGTKNDSNQGVFAGVHPTVEKYSQSATEHGADRQYSASSRESKS